MTAFDQAFGYVIGSEGGYVNDPRDPGGETKFGISKASYPAVDIAHLTLDDAKLIYRRDYWNLVRGDLLPPSVALLVFDAAVLPGIGHAKQWLQMAVGVVADGVIGPATLAALAAHKGNGTAVCAEFMAQYNVHMVSRTGWKFYGLGWSRRMMLRNYQAMGMTA